MAIDLSQAQRKTEFWLATTPKQVGPGTYEAPKSASVGNRTQINAPFNTGAV